MDLNIILSLVGILVSVVGLGFTLYQVFKLKSVTSRYQKKVMDAVDVSQDIIRNGLSISKHTISYKHLEEAINYARQEKYEFVALRMQDVESSLTEILQNETLYKELNNVQFRRHMSEFRDTMKSVQANANEPTKLNKDQIIRCLSDSRSDLISILGISTNTLYGTGCRLQTVDK